MLHKALTSTGALFFAIALAGCPSDGKLGPAGPAGAPGATGPAGATGMAGPTGPTGPTAPVVGVLTGRVVDASNADAPLAGANVAVTPGGFRTTTDATGVYRVELPSGVFALRVSATGYVEAAFDDLGVVQGATVTQNVSMQPTNPLVANAGPRQYQAGFGTTVQLDGSASTAPAGYTLTFAWRQTMGPTVALTGADTARPTFVSKSLAELISANATTLALPERFGPLGITDEESKQLSYGFELTVSARGFQKKAQVLIESVQQSGGLNNVPVNVRHLFVAPARASYAWTCQKLAAPTDASGPACAAGVLSAEATRTPTFFPTEVGTYLLREASQATPLRIFVGTYTGSRIDDGAGLRCENCHARTIVLAGRTITDKFTPWSRTRHEGALREGVDGHYGASFGTECLACHTTGYNPDAQNNGFDDVGRAASYTLPTRLQHGNWDAMPATVRSLGGVGCESCHGPGSAHASFTELQAIGKSFSASDCNQCHASAPYNTHGLQWQKSAHARFVTGLSTPSTGDPALSNFCASCHSTQGFVAWTKSGVSQQPPVTGDVAEPQTCTTCHDPHGSATAPDGSPAPNQLRVYDNVTTLVSGLAVRGAGAGALCMTCHNSRKVFSSTSQSAPHAPAQTDVLFAKNALTFNLGSYSSSPHGAVAGACVGCHMKATPAAGQPGHNEVGGHTFKVRTGNVENLSACTGCHDGLQTLNRTAFADFDGDGIIEGIQDEVAGLFNLVAGALSQKAASLWPTQTAGAAPTIVGSHGRIRILKHYTQGMCAVPEDADPCNPSHPEHPECCYAFTAGTIPQTDADAGRQQQMQDFLRAAWNLLLLQGDRSFGIHNPAFVIEVLQRSYKAVTGTEVPNATIRR